MANQGITIDFTPESKATLQRIKVWPQSLMPALAKTMDDQNLLTVSHIQEKYLSFSRKADYTRALLVTIKKTLGAG